jgi:hypothetical protein
MPEGEAKIEAGGAEDISSGPVQSRGVPCIGRDPLWCVLFIIHIGVFVYLGLDAQVNGDWRRMVNGQDYMGNVCGAVGKNSYIFDKNLEDYPYVYYSLNITSVMSKMADSMGLKPGSSQAGLMNTAEMLQGDPGAAMMKLLGGGSGGDKFPANLINELNKYFHPVCVKSCEIGMVADGDSKKYSDDYAFRYTYWPGYTEWAGGWQQPVWDGFFTATPTPALKAYDPTDCPYSPSVCVPMNSMVDGMMMTSIESSEGAGFCVPTLESAEALAAGIAAASDEAAAVIPSDFAEKSEDFVGSAVADLITAAYTFAIMAFVGLVIGVVYLVLMRYIVGPLVWISLIGVAVLLIGGAALLYLQSIKCAAPPEVEPAASVAPSPTPPPTAADTNSTNSSRLLEDLVMDFQRVLSEDEGLSAYGKCPETCANGCVVASQTARQACLVGALILIVLGAFYLCCLACNFNRIQLAIALNKVAARFVAQQPYSLAVPPIQITVVFLYLLLWIFLTVMIVSYVPDYFQVNQGNFTYEEAYGIEAEGYFSSGTAGSCWENGQYQVQIPDDKYGGRAAINETTGLPVYRCVLLPYVGGQDYRFWYALFSLLWINAFMIAFGQTSIAGAVGSWYFAKNEEKLRPTYVPWGVKTALTYHMGSIAFGSFIIALIQLLKYYLMYLQKQAEKQHNKLLSIIFGILAYAVWCMEKCAKFISKNAYIQIALCGKKFCSAAKDAFFLIFRNAGRIMAAGMISPVINWLGFLIITLSTVFIGFMLIEVFGLKLNSPVGPCIIYLIEGWVCGSLVMNVFGLGVDTVLQCFVADEEINGTVGEHTPYELTSFLDENKDALEKVKGPGKASADEGAQA